MSCFVCFSLRPLQMRQEKQKGSAVRSAAITYSSSTNTSGSCPRECALWHVITRAAYCLCLCCCSAAAPPPTVLPHGYTLVWSFSSPFCFPCCRWILNQFACRLTSCQPVWLKVYKTFGTFRCAVALSGILYALHCTVYAYSHTFFFFCYRPLD